MRSLKIIVSLIFSLGLSGVLLNMFSKRINFQEVKQILVHAHVFYILACAITLLISHFIRAQRWQYLLVPINKNATVKASFIGFLVGTACNILLPYVGDVVRCKIVNKLDGLPTSQLFGSVLAERLIDTITILLLLTVLIILDTRILQIASFLHLPILDLYFVIGIILIILLMFMAFHFYNIYSIKTSISKLFSNIYIGLQSYNNLRNKKSFLISCITIWAFYLIATYCLLKAVDTGVPISIVEVLAVLIAASFAWGAPTQAGIGAFHLLVSKTLIIYGMPLQEALSIAILMHATFILFDILYAIIASIFLIKTYPYSKLPIAEPRLSI